MRFPVHHCMLQNSTRYDSTRGGMTGAGGTHIIPGTLAQYVGRHYTTQVMPALGYSIPALTWVQQNMMRPAPPHHSTQIDMIPQADPGAVQYGSIVSQLATDTSALQIGN
ncbi:Hypothetical protein CINCED_3A007900 [Cinara cedri]|uniref:Uncharacterized protein n=1 Tax=Cinara cedri TaxID=506608 RepID=A0A5E4NQ78_9HEMI|nr:Hypothetical protein CINCED_3A007900 [Cinara cedri]